MSATKIYLGVTSNGSTWLEKHKWDCGWYWAFGYVGNSQCHFHIDSLIDHPAYHDDKWTDVNRHFTKTWLTQEQWWILRDLFIQAYALKKAAETYRYGGHQTSKAAPQRIISEEMASKINADLGKLLDNIWELLIVWYPE